MRLLQASTAPAGQPAPAQPATPSAISTAGAEIATRPMTAADAAALRAKRSELSNQLNSAQGRREELIKELRSSPDGVARAGLEARLVVLDQRIVQLETEIALNGQQLARAPLALAANSEERQADRFGPFSSGQLTAISIVGTVTVLMPLAVSLGRLLFKRASTPKPAPQVLESAARLERMEHAIDAMSVEIERISEGQRFVTQLMAPKVKEPVMVESGDRPL